ncbi:ImmA/IrrE family metallo-endopeptidase [Pedococcus bigeumensis]|uniref:ImmA/IrrE family metallo-endopeptidase n=1 Tax=Pedococcus bigeumensis TaxID=433644 RepID=UPI002FEB1AA2
MSTTEQANLVGERVRAAIRRAFQTATPTDASIAADIGMKPDAFSRAMSGNRAFSSLEIARLADVLSEDVHWLITGEPDPLSVRIAARHTWDAETRDHHRPDAAADDATLDGVALAYRQASQWRTDPVEALPTDPAEIRGALGEGFVQTFADRTEQALKIDVIRIQNLSTDYSFTIGERRVILLKSEPHWFRSNWSLAHEIAHLALRHHNVTGKHADSQYEAPANRFASELLLPEQVIRNVDWAACDEADLARHLWAYGVSTEALANRLSTLGLPVPAILTVRPAGSTMRLLRRQREALPVMTYPGTPFAVIDPITHRFNAAAERRIPEALIAAHLDGIAAGRLNKGTLAWLLEVTPDEVEVEEPLPETMTTDQLMSALGL